MNCVSFFLSEVKTLQVTFSLFSLSSVLLSMKIKNILKIHFS